MCFSVLHSSRPVWISLLLIMKSFLCYIVIHVLSVANSRALIKSRKRRAFKLSLISHKKICDIFSLSSITFFFVLRTSLTNFSSCAVSPVSSVVLWFVKSWHLMLKKTEEKKMWGRKIRKLLVSRGKGTDQLVPFVSSRLLELVEAISRNDFKYLYLTFINYTEHQKKLITSSERHSLKSKALKWIIIGHRLKIYSTPCQDISKNKHLLE